MASTPSPVEVWTALDTVLWMVLTGAGLITRGMSVVRMRRIYRTLWLAHETAAAHIARDLLVGEWLALMAWVALMGTGILALEVQRTDTPSPREVILGTCLLVVVVVLLLRNLVDNLVGARITTQSNIVRESGK